MPALDPLLPLAGILDPIFDPLTIRATRAVQRLVVGPPLRLTQRDARERALASVLARHGARIEALGPKVRARDAAAEAELDAAIDAAVRELRGHAEAAAAQSTLQRVTHAIDRLLYRDAEEWLDDPRFDRALRVRTLERLDRLNEAIGSYEAFFTALEPLIARAQRRGPPTVVDLASGHGMFAVALALRFGARGGAVRVAATDLAPEYLELGRARARSLSLDPPAMRFFAQDALDLRDLEAKLGPVDVLCCTQTLHHFSPGMVARLLAEAASVAREGVVLVDGERNPFALAMIGAVTAALGRGSVPFLHDSIASMRRMYTEQELALIAAMAPRAAGEPKLRIERGWLPPGHVYVRVLTGTA